MRLDTRQTANLLSTAGLIPFAVLCLVVIVLPAWRLQAAFALAAYGATILSFIGAVHWGLAISRSEEAVSRPVLLVASNVPFFVAWAALLLPIKPGLLLLAAGIFGVLALDRWSVVRDLAPAWWWPLRLRLSLTAGALLFVGGLFAP